MSGAVDQAWETFEDSALARAALTRELRQVIRSAFYAGARVVLTETLRARDPQQPVDGVLDALEEIEADVDRYLAEGHR
ncbi:MAG TPA: hypothetical protein VF491_17670 [Vicinamibacterales bacterium]